MWCGGFTLSCEATHNLKLSNTSSQTWYMAQHTPISRSQVIEGASSYQLGAVDNCTVSRKMCI